MPLPLSPTPRPVHLPDLERRIEAIAPVVRDVLRQLVRGDSPRGWPLFLHGPPGLGKTCAALILLDYAGGEYHTAKGLGEYLTQAQQGRLVWQRQGLGGILYPETVWRTLARAPLVVLDELGSRERVSEHHYDCVRQLFDCRQRNPFVVLSNANLQAIGRLYDDRIASRLGQGTILEVDGPDRRLE